MEQLRGAVRLPRYAQQGAECDEYLAADFARLSWGMAQLEGPGIVFSWYPLLRNHTADIHGYKLSATRDYFTTHVRVSDIEAGIINPLEEAEAHRSADGLWEPRRYECMCPWEPLRLRDVDAPGMDYNVARAICEACRRWLELAGLPLGASDAEPDAAMPAAPARAECDDDQGAASSADVGGHLDEETEFAMAMEISRCAAEEEEDLAMALQASQWEADEQARREAQEQASRAAGAGPSSSPAPTGRRRDGEGEGPVHASGGRDPDVPGGPSQRKRQEGARTGGKAPVRLEDVIRRAEPHESEDEDITMF